MGAQLAKPVGKAEAAVEKPGEAASPAKTNGQQVNDKRKVGGIGTVWATADNALFMLGITFWFAEELLIELY